MKIIYRPQRGSLYDALAEKKSFDTMEEFLLWLCKDKEKFDLQDVYISYYGYDDRIDWETYIVTVGRYFNENYLEKYHTPQAIGFMTFKY